MAEYNTSGKSVSSEAWRVMSVLSAIAIIAAVVLVVTWEDRYRIEVAKAALSVLSIAVFGGLATFALDRYRIQREVEAAKYARQIQSNAEQEATDARAAAESRSRQEENWRREVARVRDTRDREDALLRSLLEETLRSYNRIKRARRLLRAYTQRSAGHVITLRPYDLHLSDLNDEQLAFEQFKRLTPVQWTSTRSEVQHLRHDYESIETYLNELIKEYERKRHLIESSGDTGVPIMKLPRLSGFFESHYKTEDKHGKLEDIGLEPNVSKRMDNIIAQVQAALLTPVDLPSIDDVD